MPIYLNTNLRDSSKYDAIVIGSGMSGGWAAKELCQKGLHTLVLESGNMHHHIEDYTMAEKKAYEMPHRGNLTKEDRQTHQYQIRSSFINEYNKDVMLDDSANPYIEKKRFDWIRANIVGGRSKLWGRQVYRWSNLDFEANAKEGISIDWPVRYEDISAWYAYVEKFVGISGARLNLPHLPDGEFLPPMRMNALELHFRKEVEKKYQGRHVTIGRVAHLTEPQPHHLALGRGKCIQRNKCDRGCPFGAYFSSLSATLPAANATGHFYIRPESIVHSILFDEGSQRAKGVVVIDRKTKKEMEFNADVIFVCASALASTKILLNSTSNRFPNGLGNDSGELGHNLMDHHYHVGAVGQFEGMEKESHDGSRPNGIFIPRYANISAISKKSFLRGWDYQGHAYREGWGRGNDGGGVGITLKKNLEADGPWVFQLMGFGETLPYHENKMVLSRDQKDEWGIPLVEFDATLRDNEIAMRRQMKDDAAEMLQASGFKEVFPFDHAGGLGNCIHEMGTARMGRDPKNSVLNEFNQMHAVKNVFVTDGAFMTSSNCVNPSLTYMAFTARAADYAFSELKRGNL